MHLYKALTVRIIRDLRCYDAKAGNPCKLKFYRMSVFFQVKKKKNLVTLIYTCKTSPPKQTTTLNHYSLRVTVDAERSPTPCSQ